MSWKDKVKEWGGANLTFLSTDGASVNFIVVADPVLMKGKYKSKVQERIGCPIVTDEGFMLFICGKRCARKIASLEDKFKDHVINVTRHGSEGDTDSVYEVTAIADAAKVKALKTLAARTFTQAVLDEAVTEAAEVIDR